MIHARISYYIELFVRGLNVTCYSLEIFKGIFSASVVRCESSFMLFLCCSFKLCFFGFHILFRLFRA